LVAPESDAWPYILRVGKPSQAQLETDYVQVSAQADAVAAWAEAHGLLCRTEPRKVGRMTYPVLSHVVVPSVDELAHAVGKDAHWQLYRARTATLRTLFPQVGDNDLQKVLVSLNRGDAGEADFELVCAAAQWFERHDARGYTAREVPLEGFHAKWLDVAGHRQMVCVLAGLESLELKERPRLVRFRYLDPAYLSTGARAHDAWLEGDACVLPYRPRLVVICENRDTALWFPAVEGGIAVQGDGMAGTATLMGVDWIAGAERVLYWGDIDVHGFQILAAYRERGLAVRSILMDTATYQAFERFGTMVDKHGRPLQPKPDAQPLPGLTADENALYLRLCSPDHMGPRRIEQERIPLDLALEQGTC
ncbi:MAG: DUF2220 family protein, partial [Atopobiaceae bacterium]|nr:DUF2220 family protein [Atopobiaceae bacterium]